MSVILAVHPETRRAGRANFATILRGLGSPKCDMIVESDEVPEYQVWVCKRVSEVNVPFGRVRSDGRRQ